MSNAHPKLEVSMQVLLDCLPKISVQQIRLDEAIARRTAARKAYDKMAKYPDVYTAQTEVRQKRKDDAEEEVRLIEETMSTTRVSALKTFQTLFDPPTTNGDHKGQPRLQDRDPREPNVRKTTQDVETLQATLKSVLAELEKSKQRQKDLELARNDQTQKLLAQATELESMRSSMRDQSRKIDDMQALFEEKFRTMDIVRAKFDQSAADARMEKLEAAVETLKIDNSLSRQPLEVSTPNLELRVQALIQPLESQLESRIQREIEVLTTDAEAKEDIFGEEISRLDGKLDITLQAQQEFRNTLLESEGHRKNFQDTTVARLDVAIHAAHDLERRFNMIRTDEVVDSMLRRVGPQLQAAYPVLHNMKTLQVLQNTLSRVDNTVNAMRATWEGKINEMADTIEANARLVTAVHHRVDQLAEVTNRPPEQHVDQHEINGLHCDLKALQDALGDLKRLCKDLFADSGAVKLEIIEVARTLGIGDGDLPFQDMVTGTEM